MKNKLIKFVFLFVLAGFTIQPVLAKEDVSCGTRQIREVRGVSMLPLLKPGQKVFVTMGYYDCHDVKRGDLVAYHFSGDKDAPLAKKVRAAPGDAWNMIPAADGEFNIAVNGEILKNAQGQLYHIAGKKARRLQLYLHDYPRLPANTYMILGEVPEGSADSTEFGLIDKSDILGNISAQETSAFNLSSKDAKNLYVDAAPVGWSCTVRSNSSTGPLVTASCTGSEKAVEGGCEQDTTTLLGSYPTGQGWSCIMANPSGFSIYAYVNCCK